MSDVDKGRKIIQHGGIIVYPTDTLYGLGASVFEEEAVKRVYEIKKRPRHLPLPIIVSSIDDIKNVAIFNDVAYKLAKKFLPGALTIILEKKDVIPSIVAGKKLQ